MHEMPRVPPGASPRQLLSACGGFYRASGNAPLVGYAGRDEQGRQYVGYDFANFAKVERWPLLVCNHVARPLRERVTSELGEDLTVCPAPEGGKMLGALLALQLGGAYAHPEKVVIEAKTSASRERSMLGFTGRHDPPHGARVLIVEDVCNNFSTTAQYIEELELHGAQLAGIACFLNRSETRRGAYIHKGVAYPVIALWDEPLPEYAQDDPEVSDAIAAGNVFWKPKDEWGKLKERAPEHCFR